MRRRALFLALLVQGCGFLGPGQTWLDHDFESKLTRLVAGHPIGTIPLTETRTLWRQSFGHNVSQVCFINGGDWQTAVSYRWTTSQWSPPIPVENLRDIGNDDIDFDGMIAIVGISPEGIGYVRRTGLGGLDTDNGDAPRCASLDDLRMEIVLGDLMDAGPHAGQRTRVLRLTDGRTGVQMGPLNFD